MLSFIESWDRAQPSTLLKINAVLGGLILLSHVLVAVFTLQADGFKVASLIELMSFQDALAFLILVCSAVALIWPRFVESALKMQTVVLLLIGTPVLAFGVSVAVSELPEGSFVWNPVLYAFLCAYPVYLARVVYFREVLAASWWLRYCHLLVAAVTVIISAAIFGKVFWNEA